jgi:hypothetical protein
LISVDHDPLCAMTNQPDELRRPRDARTERAIWVTVALSLLVHALVLLGLPRIRLPSLEPSELSDATARSR